MWLLSTWSRSAADSPLAVPRILTHRAPRSPLTPPAPAAGASVPLCGSWAVFLWSSHSNSEHPGASKPPLSSSSMTSRILLRQQLMREQMQEQERREQQQKQQAAQFMQQRVPVSQTPAINVSVPTSLPPATQVPMEVLKVRTFPLRSSSKPALFSRDVVLGIFGNKVLQISCALAWFAACFGGLGAKNGKPFLKSLCNFCVLSTLRSPEGGFVTKLRFLSLSLWKMLLHLSST